MNAVVVLALILFLLMLIFGGKSGAIAFGTLFLNFILLVIAIIMMIFWYTYLYRNANFLYYRSSDKLIRTQ